MASTLQDRHIMVVEDNFLIAELLSCDLVEVGAFVIGPSPSVESAMAELDCEASIDVAILDVNLGADLVFPVADALARRRIPFIFVTGFDDARIRRLYPRTPICKKPCEFGAMSRMLLAVLP
jgi:two-component SAPR family response regulator